MREPGEPTEQQKVEAERWFRYWCLTEGKDPESQQAASEYEERWAEWFPPGEEQRW